VTGKHGITLAIVSVILMAAAAQAPAESSSAPVGLEEMNARIQKYRTAEVTLAVTDAGGRPLAGAAVTVQQTRHQFLFGCNAFGLSASREGPAQTAYRDRFKALLNFATLPFYWGAYERQEGQPAADGRRAMAEWCAANGIRTKGHPLCWHQVPPPWLAGKTPEEVQALQIGRITREVKGFVGLIDTWDVVNEAVVMPTYQLDKNPIAQLCKKIGAPELIKETFAAARAANPRATLVLNDYDTSPKYEALIKDSLAAGVTIDVIGIQSHQHNGYRGARWTWEACERFARFGKPLHFTETTFVSGEEKKNMDWNGHYNEWATTPEGEKRQAAQVAEFYRILFSHPAVQAITWWDFSDAGAWLGAPSGLVRKDMSPKPVYDALLKMVKTEWWTGPLTLKTDERGQVKFHGFLGAYAVESAGGRATFEVGRAGEFAVSTQLSAAKP